MGGLKKYMPITYWTSLVGSLALIGFPGTAGFFSKDALIEAVGHAGRAGSGYAYFCVLVGVFITALYSFRMFFLVFHGKERIDDDARGHLHESPWVVTLPLILLAIPAVIIGWPAIGPLLFGDFFGDSIFVQPANDVLGELGTDFHGPLGFLLHGFKSPVILLAAAGVAVAWFLYLKRPDLPAAIRDRFTRLYTLLLNKYYFDTLVEKWIPRGSEGLGNVLWKVGDVMLIDGAAVNGTARLIGWVASVVRQIQTGYLYTYAFAMIIGLATLIFWALYLR
jgi:NADH-quinone oxidoreductase subunit L